MQSSYWAGTEQLGPIIYDFQGILALLESSYKSNFMVRSEGIYVNFGDRNRGVQAVQYHGSTGCYWFPL